MIQCIKIYLINLIKHGRDYALYSVMMRILSEFYPRVGVYNDGQVIYAATNEWHLTQCMTTYLDDEETNTNDSDSPSDLGEQSRQGIQDN